MVFKLYGSPISTCTARVAVVLNEYNVPFEVVEVDLANNEHKSGPFLKIQPFGQVPYADDNGFTLYESRAITRYIAAKYQTDSSAHLLPNPATEPEKYARFEQAASVEVSHFNQWASEAAEEFIFKAFHGEQGDEELGKKHIARLYKVLDVYERILSTQKYIAGDEVTLADLSHLPYANLLHSKNYINIDDAEKRPNVSRWWKDLTSRPSWQKVLAA